MCSLSLFHYSEYLVTAINNPRSLSLDSFLLNHSFEYNLAALSSWVEFTLEKLFFPGRLLCPSLTLPSGSHGVHLSGSKVQVTLSLLPRDSPAAALPWS